MFSKGALVIYFGLYFTAETFRTIGPYLLPYLLLTCILIPISIWLAITVTKWIQVDKVTIASEALDAKPSFVLHDKEGFLMIEQNSINYFPGNSLVDQLISNQPLNYRKCL
ncbi:hypothetical protein QGM71_06375 [Virgibacillus sp. C22-A2]|uniref:Uncharacterized protein n=1 Tax=Virgibacillus tibetensis TaxID=3042313 RepID=A0ABU6KD89_9BACI|nr:hypothetical protein [Virgibacillus sp. C22-A2]